MKGRKLKSAEVTRFVAKVDKGILKVSKLLSEIHKVGNFDSTRAAVVKREVKGNMMLL